MTSPQHEDIDQTEQENEKQTTVTDVSMKDMTIFVHGCNTQADTATQCQGHYISKATKENIDGIKVRQPFNMTLRIH